MKEFLGIDVGYGYTKVYGRNVKFKFPSLVSVDTGTVLDRRNVITFNGNSFVVGIGGKDIRSDDFPFRKEYRALLYYAIVNAIKGREVKEVYVGLGVPPIFRAKRDEIRKRLSGKVEVKVGDEKYKFELKVAVFLQGWGGYIDHIYTLDGKYQKNLDTPAIYSDWGFYTIDTIITKRSWVEGEERVIPALPENESPTIKKGVSYLLKIYERFVADHYGIAIPDLRTAEKLFLEEKYPEAKKRAVEAWKREVLDEILMRYREEVWGLEKIVVFGGGANLIGDDMKVDNIPVIKLDEFANARGYFKALPSVFKRR